LKMEGDFNSWFGCAMTVSLLLLYELAFNWVCRLTTGTGISDDIRQFYGICVVFSLNRTICTKCPYKRGRAKWGRVDLHTPSRTASCQCVDLLHHSLND
jgi:hypothetical protein